MTQCTLVRLGLHQHTVFCEVAVSVGMLCLYIQEHRPLLFLQLAGGVTHKEV